MSDGTAWLLGDTEVVIYLRGQCPVENSALTSLCRVKYKKDWGLQEVFVRILDFRLGIPLAH